MGIVRANLERLDRFFAAWTGAFSWVRPRAGTVGFPRLRAGHDIDRFAADLAEAEGVMLLPGTAFDDGANHFRIGFARTDMPEALERLERFTARRLLG